MLQIIYFKDILPNSQVSEDMYVSHMEQAGQTVGVKNNSFSHYGFGLVGLHLFFKIIFHRANLFQYAG